MKYLKAIEGDKIPAETEVLTENNRLNEYIMTSLRTMWGLDLQKIDKIASAASAEVLNLAEPFFEKEWLTKKENTLYLSPKGKLYADYIASELFF